MIVPDDEIEIDSRSEGKTISFLTYGKLVRCLLEVESDGARPVYLNVTVVFEVNQATDCIC
jgi:hypothetical protein